MHTYPSPLGDGEPFDTARSTRRGNLRRLLVFATVLVVGLLAGQYWNYSRPDIYRANARLQITVPDAGAAAGGSAGAGASTAFATQLQYLNSRPLLEKVAQSLLAAGQPLPTASDDAVAQLQAMLLVTPIPESDVVQLEATGKLPALLAAFLNALPEVVLAELRANQSSAAEVHLDDARQELQRLTNATAQVRNRLAQFREQQGLLAERDENEAVAHTKGLTNALSNAREMEANAQARLQALTESGASGESGVQPRDDPALAALEGRAAQVREELREMGRIYTADFMAMDPRARALRARLNELEEQIAQRRSIGAQVAQHSALTAAQVDFAAAKKAVERLQGQLVAERPRLQGVSSRLSQAKLLADDLAQIEGARRDTLERVARLEANERRRLPGVSVLEVATVPTSPIHPDRRRDGLLVLGAALLLAALAMALVEAFNRAPIPAASPVRTTVVLPPSWTIAGPALPGAALPVLGGTGSSPALQLARTAPTLAQPQVAALLAATEGVARSCCALALLGLSPQELVALRRADVDVPNHGLKVSGPWARVVPLPPWLAQDLSALVAKHDDGPLLCNPAGQALAQAELETLAACAAMDSGLAQATSVNLEALRNTCIAWLVGQGLRFSDLPALVGSIDANGASTFADHVNAGPRLRPEQVSFLMPALLQAPPA